MGKNIRELRKAYELSADELAEKLDLSVSFLGLVERGNRLFSTKNLIKASGIFGVSLDYLVFGKSDRPDGADSFEISVSLTGAERDFITQICRLIALRGYDNVTLDVLYNTMRFQAEQIALIRRHGS